MIMKMPYLTKCCRRWPLEFGTKIVAWYSMVTAVLGIIVGFIRIAKMTRYNRVPEVAIDLKKIKILFCILDTTFSIVLLLGLYQKRPNYCFSWLIAKSILLLGQIPLYIIMSHFDTLADDLFVYLFCMGLDIYGVLIIHGHYMEITEPPSSESEV